MVRACSTRKVFLRIHSISNAKFDKVQRSETLEDSLVEQPQVEVVVPSFRLQGLPQVEDVSFTRLAGCGFTCNRRNENDSLEMISCQCFYTIINANPVNRVVRYC